ncbi:MAG: alkaline phosphatase family protein, partial [Coriobacteriia bacterium]|nr:alkaline phosphatase family protein [Coriobacteriia bacterium]
MRWLSWVAGVLALFVCLGSAFGAYELAGYSWDQVVSYKSPFADYERPWADEPSLPTPAETEQTLYLPPETTREASETARRVVLVICDGLTLDASTKMTGLNTLRQYGANTVATTPQPSLSYPTWTTILSGAPPNVSGVPTNWFDAAVPVETLIDVAWRDGRRLVVAAPDDFKTLYSADRAGASFFDKWTDKYMSATYVDRALELAESYQPELLVIHLPDADESAHAYGAASEQYAATTKRMDADLSRLISGLQDDRTVFVITADHGHVAAGGHGGWESEVTRVPAIFAGPGTILGQGDIAQVDIAPTVASLLGMRIPQQSVGRVRDDIIADSEGMVATGEREYLAFARVYASRMGQSASLGKAQHYDEVDAALSKIDDARLVKDRETRLPMALAGAGAALLALVLLFAASWRAGVAAMTGTVAYYAIYNGLYFLVHGYLWSLSAFNTEEYVQSFFYMRMAEAALAALIACVVAAAVYPMLRARPRTPHHGFLGGWLALGPATTLAIVATLAIQVAWFFWAWGADVVWRLPDLKWGFKYDLDLTQITAVGAVALLAPVVTYLVGRYHP